MYKHVNFLFFVFFFFFEQKTAYEMVSWDWSSDVWSSDLAINLRRCGDPAAFRAEVDRLITALKALPHAAGVGEIFMPGERGSRTLAERLRGGIPLPRAIVEELRGV